MRVPVRPSARRWRALGRRGCQEASAGRRARGGLMGAGAVTSVLTAVTKADAMDRYSPTASALAPRGASDTHWSPRCSLLGHRCSASG